MGVLTAVWFEETGERRDVIAYCGRCAKAEQALYESKRLLLNIEGLFLGYWTDVPQPVIQVLLPMIRENLGAFEVGRPESALAAIILRESSSE